jgi:hypothetical protein
MITEVYYVKSFGIRIFKKFGEIILIIPTTLFDVEQTKNRNTDPNILKHEINHYNYFNNTHTQTKILTTNLAGLSGGNQVVTEDISF